MLCSLGETFLQSPSITGFADKQALRLLEAAGVAMALCERDGTILWGSEAFWRHWQSGNESVVRPSNFAALWVEGDSLVQQMRGLVPGALQESESWMLREDGSGACLRLILERRTQDGIDAVCAVVGEAFGESYRSVVEHQGDFVLICTPDMRVAYMNPAFMAIVPWARPEILGRKLADVVALEATRTELASLLERIVKPEYRTTAVLPYVTRQSQRMAEWTASAVLDAKQQLVGIVLVGHDITAHDVLKKAQQEALEQLREVQRVAQIGYWEFTHATEKFWWSREFFEIIGRDFDGNALTDMASLDAHGAVSPGDRDTFFDVILHPADKARVLQVFEQGLVDRKTHSVRYRMLRPDGSERWIEANMRAPREEQSGLLRSIGTIRDVTEDVRVESELRRWGTVYENALEGVMITDAQLRIVDVNPAFTTISGYSREEALGSKPSLRRSERHDRAFFDSMWQAIHEQGRWQGEIWNLRKEGEAAPEWLSITAVKDQAGAIMSYVGIFTDISALKESQTRLEYLASHDALTGLPNRSLLYDRLEHAIGRAARENDSLAVIFIDLDGFKHINDTLGHPVGDRVLVEVGQRLREMMRASDTLGRIGGDEFLAILEDVKERASINRVVRSLIDDVARGFVIAGKDVYLGASIGIAVFPDDGKDASSLIRNADTAMYRAKQQGKNTFAFYNTDMTVAAQQRLTLEGRLRQALERDELSVLFQPKFHVGSAAHGGAEALMRWHNADMGAVSPDEFIPLAESIGLIIPMGEWVLRESCRVLQDMRARGVKLGHMAVNVSALQIQRGNLLQLVESVLAEHGLQPGDLELEITESVLIQHPEHAARVLGSLRELGVRLALDDFGTGWSSLGSLKSFPFSTLKIDRDFVGGIGTNSSDEAIVRSVVAMGKNLNLEVVAEGVENAVQLEFLSALGCDYLQGYHFSPPVKSERLETMLRGSP